MSPGPPGDGAFELVLAPGTESYDPADDRWREQVRLLYRDLDDEVGGVRREVTPVEGTKGGASSVILALGSAGAFTAAVEFFRAWLARDKGRVLELGWEVDGRTERIIIRGEAIDGATLATLATAVAAKLGAQP